MYYYVEYNCKIIAMYKSVKACIKFIDRKGLADDYENSLHIFDQTGDEYDTIFGNKIDHYDHRIY